MAAPTNRPPPRKGAKTNPGCVGIAVGTGIVVLLIYAWSAAARPASTGPVDFSVGRASVTATPAPAVVSAAPTLTLATPTLPPPRPTATPAPAVQAPPTMPPVLKIGDVLESGNWRVKVMKVERIGGELTFSTYGSKAAPIGQWFIVTAEMANVGRENFGINFWDFELHLASGVTIKHTTEIAAFGYNDFKKLTQLGKQIPPGATVTTALLFDIPKGSEGINLVFLQARDKPINVG